MWDAATGKELFSLNGHTGPVMSAAFSPDGRRVATGCMDGVARMWDVVTDAVAPVVQRDAKRRVPGAYSPDGMRLLMRSRGEQRQSRTVAVCDAATGTELVSLKGHTDPMFSGAFSPDGRRVAMHSTNGTVRIWDAMSGAELLTFKAHTKFVIWLAYSPDGRRLLTTGLEDDTARVWDCTTGKELLALKGHDGDVCGAFSPDGRRLATTGGGGIARMWDSETGQEVGSFKADTAAVFNVAFSRDGRRLATSGRDRDRTIRIWNLEDGKELLILRGHANSIRTLVFSPDGRRLVAIGDDRIARVYDTATVAELLALRRVFQVAFSLDGQRLMTADLDGTVKVLDSAPAHRDFRPRELAPPPRSTDK